MQSLVANWFLSKGRIVGTDCRSNCITDNFIKVGIKFSGSEKSQYIITLHLGGQKAKAEGRIAKHQTCKTSHIKSKNVLR